MGLVAAACGGGDSSSAKSSGHVDLRLGYFPNLTHATALVGVANGIFTKDLGSNVTLQTKTFNAGPAAVEALFSNSLDITYVGPNPAINAFQKSNGQAVRLIAGATSGGAGLVVKPSINGPADLKGKKLASPQLGNTQDVALRNWLKKNGLNTTAEGGGDVQILPQDNAQTLDTFKSGQIDGAWVPEPWTSRLVIDGKGKLLVNEASVWPDGKFLTTTVIVRTQFLKDHPDVVKNFLKGHVEATNYINSHPAEAQQAANQAIAQLTGKALAAQVVQSAWKDLTFTWDPLASTLREEATDAQTVGLLNNTNLKGLVDVAPLNSVLKADGKGSVSG
ncbi:MAG: ABC transporter substrate-binding protein [Acidimicrobiia bacterium]|nr:ABC transporter substrate-binding protein [Acidimicrobiia bacterium]MBV9041215.1 ABC transporter substrate-binding protein [Acidimicrobiia bacterium]